MTASQAPRTPGQRIRELLKSDNDPPQTHKVFSQMDVLTALGNEIIWKESGRWVKYEEMVEVGERWSKPYVASLSLHSILELRSCISSGTVILDSDANQLLLVISEFLENLINCGHLDPAYKQDLASTLLAQHIFQHTMSTHMKKHRAGNKPGMPAVRSMADMQAARHKQLEQLKAESGVSRDQSNPRLEEGDLLTPSPSQHKLNQHFMRKIPEGAEAANVFVGEVACLDKQVMGFIRLDKARVIGDITEVPIPTRFVVFILGPIGTLNRLIEMGRSISTIMVDEVFREVAYRARDRDDILCGVDEFLDQVTVLPPGEWDPEIRIEPPEKVPSQEKRMIDEFELDEEPHDELEAHGDPTLVRSGRLFGGLVADIKRKVPFFWSDIKDCAHMQSFASVIFIYLATIAPNVTFGGLLNEATHGYMGAMECILSAAVTGVLFAIFSGQPLNILGSTGPMLVLEMIIYNFCHDMGLDFMPFRLWIGIWTVGILIIIIALDLSALVSETHIDFMPFRLWIGIWTVAILMVIIMFDLSYLVRYITRFTEESFACLIAIIFIVESVKKLVKISYKHPVVGDPDVRWALNCTCMEPFVNTTVANASLFNATTVMTTSMPSNVTIDWPSLNYLECKASGGAPEDKDCLKFPDVFLLSVIEFIGTIAVALALKAFRNSSFFPTIVRQTVHDFAVLISIITFVVVDILFDVPTPKLVVPEKFAPTRPGRPWVISPISPHNPWWTILAAAIPAALSTILIFMDQQITAVIVNRRENKLKKGSGYHLDLLVVAVCILICSFLGLPWYVAATVSAIAHIMSLKKESECNAPGEKPVFLGVREQRVTAFLVGVLSGCTVLFTSVLKIIPMPVLYGVFFYMGIAACIGMQLIDRLAILVMPQKYQPDLTYLRHVRPMRVHFFTLIQVLCLAALWTIKVIKKTSIIFPLLVVGTCFVRKSMDWYFTQYELKYLDDIMPQDKRQKKEDKKKKKEEEEEGVTTKLLTNKKELEGSSISRQHSLLTSNLDVTDQLSKTGIWIQLRNAENNNVNVKNRKPGKERGSGDEDVSFFVSEEDDKSKIITEEAYKKV